ncbi:uncharacterized protein [Musca autumnalis]|uniref:uncharacterized protein n=1 Tax=Musca autumnalis TaxID=221902 RepID=UPI003CFA47CB
MTKVTNRKQLDILLSSMQARPDIATRMNEVNKEELKVFWCNLEKELNSAGPPSKSIAEWKKVWTDQRRYIRQKVAQKRPLTATEEKIHALSYMKEPVESVTNKNDLGNSSTTSISGRNHKNPIQDDIMAKHMKEHPEMTFGFLKGRKQEYEDFWIRLTKELNANGPPVRDIPDWKKSWADWRKNIRKKLSSKDSPVVRLTDAELEIVNILNSTKTQYSAHQKATLTGDTSSCDTILSDDDEDTKCSWNISPSPKRQRIETPSQNNQDDNVMSDTSIQEDLKGFPLLPEASTSREASQNQQNISSEIRRSSTFMLDNNQVVADCFQRICHKLNEIYKIQKETNKENERHHRVMEELLREKNMIKMRSLELQELKYKFELEKQQKNNE